MWNNCTKCGVKTDFEGDLHCRKVIMDKIKELQKQGKTSEAAYLFYTAPFGREWKTVLLYKIGGQFAKTIDQEEEKFKVETFKENLEKQHKKYIESIGVRYSGVSVSSKNFRSTHCYNCKAPLHANFHLECNACHWLICECGACGCDYGKI